MALAIEPEGHPPHRSSAPPLRVAAAVVLGLFVLYNANFRDSGGFDAFGSTLMPASILGEANFDLNEFWPWIRDDLPMVYVTGLSAFGAVQTREGHLLSSYPPGGPLLAAPVYALPYALGWLDHWHAMRIAGKVSASLMVALSAGIVLLALHGSVGPRAALLLTAAYALGTPAWPIASQGMWQHGPGLLCLSLALLGATRLERGGGAGAAALTGAALGMGVVVRTTNIAAALPLTVFVIVRHRRVLIPFAAPAMVLALWIGWYNLSTFETLSGGYDAVLGSPAHAFRGFDLSSVFTNPLGYGLASILVSPSKGLLAYCPHLGFGIAAAIAAYRLRGRSPLAPYLAAWVALSLVLLAKNRLWWGGSAFGPRYLTEATLALTFLLAALWPVLRAHRLWRSAFVATVCMSIGIQTLGAFFAPCGWSDTPVWSDRHPERHWDWRDPEIARCFAHGLEHGPVPPTLLQPETSRRADDGAEPARPF